MIHMQLWALDTIHHAAFNKLPNALYCTLPSTLLDMLPITLPLALNVTQPACLTVHSQTRSQEALKYTPKHALKYASNWTQRYTPSLLGSTLPSTLSRRKILPIFCDCMLTCTLLHAQSRDLLSCRYHAPGGVRQVVYSGQYLEDGMWHVVCGRWWAVYGGRIMTLVNVIV